MREEYDDTVAGKQLSPESLMMGYGYRPEWSEGALKIPIFQTSTFVFESAEAGKAFFEVAYGLREKEPGEETGLIYSRLNNPDVGMVHPENDPDAGKTRWAYDPHIDPALQFDTGRAQIERLIAVGARNSHWARVDLILQSVAKTSIAMNRQANSIATAL